MNRDKEDLVQNDKDKRKKKAATFPLLFFLTFSLSFFFISGGFFSLALGQDANIVDESLEDLTIVGGAGLGGAILGLSTLPFEEQPTQHLRHILVGGSLGIIIGVVIIAWNKATKSQDFIESHVPPLGPLSPRMARLSWHHEQEKHPELFPRPSWGPGFSFSKSF